MLIGLLTVLLAAAAAGAVAYRARAGATAAAPEPVEILLGPQDLKQLLASSDTAPPERKGPAPSLLKPSQALMRLRELALGTSVRGEPGPEHAAVRAAAIAATEDSAALRQLAPRRPSLLP